MFHNIQFLGYTRLNAAKLKNVSPFLLINETIKISQRYTSTTIVRDVKFLVTLHVRGRHIKLRCGFLLPSGRRKILFPSKNPGFFFDGFSFLQFYILFYKSFLVSIKSIRFHLKRGKGGKLKNFQVFPELGAGLKRN